MKELSKRVRRKGIIKIFFSLLVEILVIFGITNQSDIEGFSIIVCSILWSIVCIVYFIGGIRNIINSNKNIEEYIQKSNFSKQQLDTEFINSKKFSNLYVGTTHVFAISSDAPYIIPIKDIQTMFYKHLGSNPAKGRMGYYYLYLKGEKISDDIKIYYIFKEDVKDTMDYLLQINNNIVVE